MRGTVSSQVCLGKWALAVYSALTICFNPFFCHVIIEHRTSEVGSLACPRASTEIEGLLPFKVASTSLVMPTACGMRRTGESCWSCLRLEELLDPSSLSDAEGILRSARMPKMLLVYG